MIRNELKPLFPLFVTSFILSNDIMITTREKSLKGPKRTHFLTLLFGQFFVVGGVKYFNKIPFTGIEGRNNNHSALTFNHLTVMYKK